ncbi:MAG: S9 family peptidase, partial [bacterium]|nr:S9 family peptidase [bacterium]
MQLVSLSQTAFRLATFVILVHASITWSQEAPIKKYTIAQFLKTVSYSGSSLSPDLQKVLVSSDESGVFNAYAIDVVSGQRQQLTESTQDSIFAVDYFPSDERFLYTADQGGNELNHLFVRQLNGESKDLTPGENLKAQFLGWSADDQSFFVGSNRRDPRYFDVFEFQTDTLESSMVFQNDAGYLFADASPDGQLLALSQVATRYDSDIFLYHRATGAMERI